MDGNAPQRVFKIGELARVIASQLVLISRKSTANLARACRYLEEPALSALWETQSSWLVLLETMQDTWSHQYPGCGRQVLKLWKGCPSPEAWNRVQRYASWMRRVDVDGVWELGEDTLHELRLNSPADGWFPALQDFSWCITRYNLLYVSLFFSPNLKRISISISRPWKKHMGTPVDPAPHEILPILASTISALPASTLQRLSVSVGDCGVPPAYFKDSLSSVVLRCGSSFTKFTSPTPISDAAAHHLIHLPNLRAWHTEHPPPSYPASALPLVFPPLTELKLGEGAPSGWLSLFERLDYDSSTQGMTPLSRVKESLKLLIVKDFSNLIIDISFASVSRKFRNLISLDIGVHCHSSNGNGQCAFELNDDDIAQLAMALPRLKHLLLGYPCGKNTCATTVVCLLHISARCPWLQSLGVHFNTTNIVDDLRNISEDAQFEELRLLPKCTLSLLNVHQMPLALGESDLETVADGMTDILPHLEHCEGASWFWGGLNEKIAQI